MKSFKNYLTELYPNNDEGHDTEFMNSMNSAMKSTPYSHHETDGEYKFPNIGEALHSMASAAVYGTILEYAPKHMGHMANVGKQLFKSASDFRNTMLPHIHDMVTKVKTGLSSRNPIRNLPNNDIIHGMLDNIHKNSLTDMHTKAEKQERDLGGETTRNIQRDIYNHALRYYHTIKTASEKHPHQFIINGGGDSLNIRDGDEPVKPSIGAAQFIPNIPRPQDPTPPNNN
jgi:hypothetical protein